MKKLVVIAATLVTTTLVPVLGMAHTNSYNTTFMGGDSYFYTYRIDEEYSTADSSEACWTPAAQGKTAQIFSSSHGIYIPTGTVGQIPGDRCGYGTSFSPQKLPPTKEMVWAPLRYKISVLGGVANAHLTIETSLPVGQLVDQASVASLTITVTYTQKDATHPATCSAVTGIPGYSCHVDP